MILFIATKNYRSENLVIATKFKGKIFPKFVHNQFRTDFAVSLGFQFKVGLILFENIFD